MPKGILWGMGTTQRRQRIKDNLRRAILDAARELFVTQGFDNVSMRKIAEKIEYSPTTIYSHFKDKDEIFVTLAEEGFSLLADRLEPYHIRIADPIERLRQASLEYFTFAREQPHYYQIMFAIKAMPIHDGLWEKGNEKYLQEGFRAFSFIMRCIHEGIALGKIPHGDLSEHNVSVLSHVFWASVHGVSALVLADRSVKLPCDFGMDISEELLHSTLDNTLRGLTH